MAALQPSLTRFPRAFRHHCNRRRHSLSRRGNPTFLQFIMFRQGSLVSISRSILPYGVKKPIPSRRSMKSSSFILVSEWNPRQGCHMLSAKERRVFGGAESATKFSICIPICNPNKASSGSPTARLGDKFNKGFRKTGRQRTKLEEKIQKGFQKVGLERQFGELPQWSAYVPIVVGGLEAIVLVGRSLNGSLQGGVFREEGLLVLLLGINFIVGWLASQMSTWKVQALSPTLLGRGKEAVSPGILEFIGSFLINVIPYGNFLAWTRFSWKENSSVSSLNALVYVVPSLVTLVLWSQGFTIGRVEQIAWLLGVIHRPYDVARVHNEKLLAAVNAKIENARKTKEEKESLEKEPELTEEELALLQQRKEFEEFDILLARSTNGTSSIPGHPQDWSVGDTLQWLAQEGFARYATTFAENDIDGAILLHLTLDDLRNELGIQSLGDRTKLGQAIERLKSQS